MPEEPKLDKISDTLMNHMHAETEKGTRDGSTPLEAIMKGKPAQRGRARKQPEILDLDGFHIYNEPMALLFFRLVQMKNTFVDQILTEAQFNMADIAGKPIFPRPNEPQL